MINYLRSRKFIINLTVLLISVFPLSSSKSYFSTYYVASFDKSNIDTAIDTMKSIAEKWNLEVHEQSRLGMKALAGGEDAFYIELIYSNASYFKLTNVPTANRITYVSEDHGDLPEGKFSTIDFELRATLEGALDTKFGESNTYESRYIGPDPN